MKLKHALLFFFTIALIWSCGKDDGPTPSVDENSVPVIAAKTFTVAETITDTEVIGTVTATDADEDDTLTFSIATNSDALFEITATGDLSLASGKTLDAATKEQHAITVKVDDGEDTASATITIKVTSEEVTPTNEAPEMADQEFTPKEDIADTDEIGQVMATDADDDTLTFELKENDNDLFMLSEIGILTLAEGKSLDYETATSHSITVSVTDGEETVEATITITVENVVESMAEDPASFVTTWKTEANGEEITIGVDVFYNMNYTIDWGDGTLEELTEADGNPTHVYSMPGVYTVAIQGDFPSIQMFNSSDGDKLMSLEQWGNIQWKTFYNAFYQCEEMQYNATDVPDLTNLSNMGYMFYGATSFNGNISSWDVSNVATMRSMFEGATSFNGDISGWNTSGVTSMKDMFSDATSFNGNISEWNTSNVMSMSGMFFSASSFDQDLGGWNIGNVEDMSFMFDDSGMSKENLNATLIGWSNYVDANNGPDNITLGLDNLLICGPDVFAAVTVLNQNGWGFFGDVNYANECP
ncbi:BspA family leucine-rich repeat surface protein [Flagellimonas crocea]|uniref:BspA family leucine-rich repeat surface protein n=1 Tax=Flagellimonas crocea TaxID=3067311 RepID=UPI00296E76E9|nr:BspA family leucine-rich repeat surface protein [Muricauda sp. DH64]